MKQTIRPLGLTLALAGAAGLSALAEPVSDRFDGTYTGEARLVEPLSDGTECMRQTSHRITIEDGELRGGPTDGDTDGDPRITGIVTSDGFFTGTYAIPDGEDSVFEGRIEGDVLTAGLFDDGRCAWVIDLARADTQQGRSGGGR
ncbi:MAG: hypothetical protein ACFB22_04360 [Rhodothalassiaceae bacterium]